MTANKPMMPCQLVLFAVLATLMASQAAAAQDADAVKAGLKIAQEECSGCHEINHRAPAGKQGAPAFKDIASMSSATHLSIRVFLQTTHRNKTMPSIMLSENDMNALAHYILSLKK